MKFDCYLEKMKKLLGNEYDSYVQSLNEPYKKAIRLNTNKMNKPEFENVCNFDIRQNTVVDNSYYIESDNGVGNTILSHLGVVYSQEPSASIPVFAVKNDLCGKIVLDMCASPGGKTGQLAEFVTDSGFVISNEVDAKRINVLRGNVEKMGYKNVAIISNFSGKIADVLEDKIDIVIVDAPCSGEGMFRKNPDTRSEWTEDGILFNGQRQFEILQNAKKIVKKYGKIVYSTCTFDKNEDEYVVYNFLKSNPNFHLVRLSESIEKVSDPANIPEMDLSYARKFYPHKNFGEGQFVAVLQRDDGEDDASYSTKLEHPTKAELFLVQKFFKDIGFNKNVELCKIGGYIFIAPNNFINLKGLNQKTFGVCLGNIEKGRFEPHHNFFTAFGEEVENRIDLSIDDLRVKKFIAGEQICGEVRDGYVAICVQGICLGFGKAKSKLINNHYPKGLRMIIK